MEQIAFHCKKAHLALEIRAIRSWNGSLPTWEEWTY